MIQTVETQSRRMGSVAQTYLLYPSPVTQYDIILENVGQRAEEEEQVRFARFGKRRCPRLVPVCPGVQRRHETRAESRVGVSRRAEGRDQTAQIHDLTSTRRQRLLRIGCRVRMLRTREQLRLWPPFEKLDHRIDVVVRQLL